MAAVQYLAGRYRLVERLGSGGMSVVWRAFDEVLGRPVAVKLLGPRFAADPGSRDRIRDEARAAARLCHPYITNVHDYGESTAADGATVPFVVMELVDGQPLDARLAGGPLPWWFAVQVGAQVGAALAAVHARGLVHRDVKPANIMLTPTGAKLVDFGITAVAGHRPERGSKVFGTPAYLAPERLDGGPADAASDVYALGLVLYKALSGRLPWDANTTTQMLTAHCYVPPEPLPKIAGLPPAVVKLCTRCLGKDPESRPQSAEVARVLAEVADIRVPLLGVPVFGAPGPQTQPGRTGSDRTRRRTDGRRSTGLRPTGRRLARVGVLGTGLAAAALLITTCAGQDAAAPPAEAADARQAAAAAPGGNDARVARHELGCQVVYSTRADVAGRFDVDVTIANTGSRSLQDWVLAFEYPGDQRVVQLSGATFTQDDSRVLVQGTAALPAGGTATIALTGAYGAANPMPTTFELAGQRCLGRLVGAAAPAAPLPAAPAARGSGGGSGSEAGTGSGSSGRGKSKGKNKGGGGDDGGDGDD